MQNGMERARYMSDREPMHRGRSIMYAYWINRPIFTEHILVACCANIGTYMVNYRRENSRRATYGNYNTNWNTAPEGAQVRHLC